MAISTNVEAQREIDEEIEVHMVVVRRLLKERNTYSAVDQLPDELLSAFFRAANDGDIDSVLTMASVCSRWRQICLDTPQLWTSISLKYPRWCTELLSRSKQCPLAVDLRDYDYGRGKEGLSRIAQNLVPHTSRFADISIGGYTEEDLDALMSLFLRPSFEITAPLLEEASIVIPSKPCQMVGSLWTELNSLQTLTLTGILPMTTAPMPVLTRLDIDASEQGNRLSVPWLVDLLRNAPRIETFNIQVVASDVPFVVMGALPVSVPDLRNIDLTMMGFRELKLLSYLEIPAVTGVRLTILPRNDETCPKTNFVPLRSFLSRYITHDIPSLEVVMFDGDNYDTTHFYLYGMDAAGEEFCSLSLYFPTLGLNRVNLVGSVPLKQTRRLQISCRMKEEEILAWSEKIALCPQLRELEVDRVALILSIAVVPSISSEPPSGAFILVELERIIICSDAWSTPRDWAQLIRICQYHYKCGKRLELRIWYSNIPISYVEYLKGCTDLGWNEEGSAELVEPFEELHIDE